MQPDDNSSYNQIFEKLVVSQDENSVERLIGMLAHAEYKLDKYEWVSSKPTVTPIEIQAFLDRYNERMLGKYRNDAETVLLSYASQYAEAVLQERLEKLRDEAISKELKTIEANLTREIRATKVSYMKPVWQGIISSAIFTFILFILALLIRFAAPDSSIGQLLQYLSAPDTYKIRVDKIK
jgi:hypothetical protein